MNKRNSSKRLKKLNSYDIINYTYSEIYFKQIRWKYAEK